MFSDLPAEAPNPPAIPPPYILDEALMLAPPILIIWTTDVSREEYRATLTSKVPFVM
jgi:hypothetical protein